MKMTDGEALGGPYPVLEKVYKESSAEEAGIQPGYFFSRGYGAPAPQAGMGIVAMAA